MGCYLHPPGFPSYFLQPIWTQYGNQPPHGRPQRVISFPGKGIHVVPEKYDLKKLWNPLPIDHERTRMWILSLYKYFQYCYSDPDSLGSLDDVLIYPVPYYKLGRFVDDPRFSNEWRDKEQAAIAQKNAKIIAAAAAKATTENHKAVLVIRKYYPEYEPDLELIANPPTDNIPQWWTVEASCPLPENCAPRGFKHPVNKTWCQFCGWKEEVTT